MSQDPCDGLRIGQTGDERERRLTGGTEEGKHLMGPSQEGGPSWGASGARARVSDAAGPGTNEVRTGERGRVG
jgi:hypothetical protein